LKQIELMQKVFGEEWLGEDYWEKG